LTTINEWLSFFKNGDSIEKYLQKDYGKDYPHFETKRSSILRLLNLHMDNFGDENIIIVRSPARINLMGRHIDHQGGELVCLAIDQEIFITASLRHDSLIHAFNAEDLQYPEIILDFSELKGRLKRDWSDVIKDPYLLEEFRTQEGSWENYISSAYIKLSHHFGIEKIKGVNICVFGNILTAAGLSSSSALTLGVFEAILNLNGLMLDDKKIIKLCSEAEWFVGTRGGSADHIAIKTSRKNEITHVKLFGCEILDRAVFPENLVLLIYNSNILSDKSGSKRDLFNQNVLSYELGFHSIKLQFPEYRSKLKYLRDVNKTNLGVSDKELFEILLALPEKLQYIHLPESIENKWSKIIDKYKFKTIPKYLPIRKVVAYGISECHRSIEFFNLLKQGKSKEAGALMFISHKGDRVEQYNSDYNESKWINELTDQDLRLSIALNEKIEHLYGGYGCSIPEIDFIIDLSAKIEGVYGAQLSGAGLGGCAMILGEKDKGDYIINVLSESYERKFKKKCLVELCHSVNGLSKYIDL